MVSPELLASFPFLSVLPENHLKALAQVAEEYALEPGITLYEADSPAESLYLVTDGIIDLYLIQEDPQQPGEQKEYYLNEVCAGEVLGISAMIEPFRHTVTARVRHSGSVIRIGSDALRALGERDAHVKYLLMFQVARAAADRLQRTRIAMASKCN